MKCPFIGVCHVIVISETSDIDDLDAILMEVELETRKKAAVTASKSFKKNVKSRYMIKLIKHGLDI